MTQVDFELVLLILCLTSADCRAASELAELKLYKRLVTLLRRWRQKVRNWYHLGLHREFQAILTKNKQMGWKGDLAVKSTCCCFYGRPRIDFQHLHGGSQPCITSVPGDSVPSWAPGMHVVYRHNMQA